LNVSEVIREFIRTHETLSEPDAFARFLEEERIRTWVGSDPERREKIRREFARQWAEMHEAAPGAGQAQRAPTVVQVAREPAQAKPQAPPPVANVQRPEGASRKLTLMCPACREVEVWTRGSLIECRGCGRHYDNMLDLVPVHPVGPFTYLFGEGVVGFATAVGLVLMLIAIYGVFRWA
jgi:hypothetical protein